MNDSYSEAKGSVEDTGTAATMKFRSVLRRFIFWSSMVVLLVVGTSFFATWRQEPEQTPEQAAQSSPRERQTSAATSKAAVSLASSDLSSGQQKMPIPAGKGVRSPFIRYPAGMDGSKKLAVSGRYDFLLHNVFEGGKECTFKETCPAGIPQVGFYVTNEVNVENEITYALVPK